MGTRTSFAPDVEPPSARPAWAASGGVLHRRRACGQHTVSDAVCDACSHKAESSRQPVSLLSRRGENERKDRIPGIVDDVVRSPGHPLDAQTRAFFQPRFQQDFSQVRVHTDEKAAASARAVDAVAYTVGSDVVFDSGRYAPGTGPGEKLLAHELAHVMQQGSRPMADGASVSQPSDPHEREAERVSDEIMQELGVPSDDQQHPGPKDCALLPASDAPTALRVLRQATEDRSEGARPPAAEETSPKGTEEGFEIDPDDLMIMPSWRAVAVPARPSVSAGQDTPRLQRQGAAGTRCDAPERMRKVISGTFEGGKTLDDYFPDQVGRGIWSSNNTAGPFDTGSRAGSAVQLIGELPIPCATSSAPTTLGQRVTIVRARANGRKMQEGGRDFEGQTLDDIARSGRDQSRAPFRQTWTGAVTMADPISGIPYAGLRSYEFECNLTTSLTGAGGSVSVGWGITIEASGGRVTKNEVR